MNLDTYDFIFDIPSGGDSDNDCYYERRWVEIKKCMLNKDRTTEIVIPEGVEVIGEYAFINFVNLKKITFPSTLTRIREGAFECCKSLESIEFNNPLRIDSDAFRFCESLKSIEINFTNSRKSPELVWENNRKPGELPGYIIVTHDNGLIWRGAFKNCSKLKEIQLCNQMEYYESDESLKNVNITGGKSR